MQMRIFHIWGQSDLHLHMSSHPDLHPNILAKLDGDLPFFPAVQSTAGRELEDDPAYYEVDTEPRVSLCTDNCRPCELSELPKRSHRDTQMGCRRPSLKRGFGG